jgi:triosephosphate isomerase
LNPSIRKPVIAGNWKMYKTIGETEKFFAEIKPLLGDTKHCEMVVAPPFTALQKAAEAAAPLGIGVAAQDIYWEAEGAWTGEVSAAMAKDAGCTYTLIGHSERRQFFGETDRGVNRKIRAALKEGIQAIVCVGELLAEREANQTEKVLEKQLTGGFSGLTEQDFSRIIVAYEPVWAIGTGRTATPEIAQQAHHFIRTRLGSIVPPEAAERVRVLYGGSVKPDNIAGLMAQTDIDGALVGGASLQAKSFAAIVHFQGS